MSTNKAGSEIILGAIKEGFKKEITLVIEAEYEKMKKDFADKLDREKAQAIAGLTLHIMKQIEFRDIGDKIVISIQNDKQ